MSIAWALHIHRSIEDGPITAWAPNYQTVRQQGQDRPRTQRRVRTTSHSDVSSL